MITGEALELFTAKIAIAARIKKPIHKNIFMVFTSFSKVLCDLITLLKYLLPFNPCGPNDQFPLIFEQNQIGRTA